jgi:zinc transport system substrate-binding protein
VRAVRVVHALFLRVLVVLGLVIGLSSGACMRKAGPRLKVAVTLFPIYDLARTVAGPDADVVLLVPPGFPVEDASALPRGADAMSGVGLGIMVGLGLDEWMKTLLDQKAPSAHRLIVGDRVPTIPIRQSAGVAPPAPDPHVWLDPERAMLMSKAIAEEMARTDPVHAVAYRRRSFALQQDLDGLDREIDARIGMWASRSFAFFDPAFAYYADRYHLEIHTGVAAAPQEVPPVVLDPLGGQAETDTYDKLIRFNTSALERLVKSPVPPIKDASASPSR